MKMSKLSNQTNSQDPQAVNSRIFVGNLNTFQCSKADVERMFQIYGRLAGISMHKGYAFVQFTNPFDARNACHGEDGRVVLSQTLDVNMVAEPKPHQIGRKRQNVSKTGNDWDYFYDSYCSSALLRGSGIRPKKRKRLMTNGSTRLLNDGSATNGLNNAAAAAAAAVAAQQHQQFSQQQQQQQHAAAAAMAAMANLLPHQTYYHQQGVLTNVANGATLANAGAAQCGGATVGNSAQHHHSSLNAFLLHQQHQQQQQQIKQQQHQQQQQQQQQQYVAAVNAAQMKNSASVTPGATVSPGPQNSTLSDSASVNVSPNGLFSCAPASQATQNLNTLQNLGLQQSSQQLSQHVYHPQQQPQQPQQNLPADQGTCNQQWGPFKFKVYSNPDTLICGNCRECFSELAELLDHKRSYCKLRFTCKCQNVALAATGVATATTAMAAGTSTATTKTSKEALSSNTKLLCAVCKDAFVNPWDLMVHAQAAHLFNIYELGDETSNTNNSNDISDNNNNNNNNNNKSNNDLNSNNQQFNVNYHDAKLAAFPATSSAMQTTQTTMTTTTTTTTTTTAIATAAITSATKLGGIGEISDTINEFNETYEGAAAMKMIALANNNCNSKNLDEIEIMAKEPNNNNVNMKAFDSDQSNGFNRNSNDKQMSPTTMTSTTTTSIVGRIATGSTAIPSTRTQANKLASGQMNGLLMDVDIAGCLIGDTNRHRNNSNTNATTTITNKSKNALNDDNNNSSKGESNMCGDGRMATIDNVGHIGNTECSGNSVAFHGIGMNMTSDGGSGNGCGDSGLGIRSVNSCESMLSNTNLSDVEHSSHCMEIKFSICNSPNEPLIIKEDADRDDLSFEDRMSVSSQQANQSDDIKPSSDSISSRGSSPATDKDEQQLQQPTSRSCFVRALSIETSVRDGSVQPNAATLGLLSNGLNLSLANGSTAAAAATAIAPQ